MPSESLLSSTPDTVPGHHEALRRWPEPTTLNWADVWSALQDAYGDVTIAVAGGTRSLSATRPDGSVIVVGSDEGPWTPSPDGWEAVQTLYFLVSVWSSLPRLLDGHDEDDWLCVGPSIPALRTVLGLPSDVSHPPITGAVTRGAGAAISITDEVEDDAPADGDFLCLACGLTFAARSAVDRHHAARGHAAFARFVPPR